ncbi:hypothetical protein Poli38472_007993 [Pythium oligandrum]|uniref:Protein kinase domain-containing protein n=1 Tax=Pythium oligandrum TaxID=41045 RepID=A0A8K1CMF6_PYTOL|nr:hypothetical protein Poli38472_007993 [Pythium oligandrum]|eukprot:TMW65351.1 hypothetical protein Poli38472_007993 [Pythium oligandrum]
MARKADKRDLRDVFHEKKRNAVVLSSLATIHTLCRQVMERQYSARHLHSRLHQTFLKMSADGVDVNASLGPRNLAKFTGFLDGFYDVLKRHAKLHGNIVRRALHHRMFSLQLCSIHHQLSTFLRQVGAVDGFPVEWKSGFESALRQDENVLYDTAMTVLKASSFLSKEYTSLGKKQQMEVLMEIRYELARPVHLSPVLEDVLKAIYRKLTRLFGWDLTERLRRLPRWFLPLSSIEFSTSRDQLVKHKPIYRGEIAVEDDYGLKRHMIVMKCLPVDAGQNHIDKMLRAYHEFMERYGDVDHPNLLRMRGANFVSQTAYIVRDYAVRGTVTGYLSRVKQEHPEEGLEELTLRFLIQACEGLIYLHEHKRLAHGNLKTSNLLIDHRARVVIADYGIRFLRERFRVEARLSELEEARWMAPECLQSNRNVQTSSQSLTAAIARDIYSLGMCIVEILSGDVPWAGTDAMQVAELKRSHSYVLPRITSVPGKIWSVVKKMCATDPATRLPLRDVLAELKNLDPHDLLHDPNAEEAPHSTKAVVSDSDTDSLASYKTTLDVFEGSIVNEGAKQAKPEEVPAKKGTEKGTEEPVSTSNTEFDAYSSGTDGSFDEDEGDCKEIPIAIHTNTQIQNAIDYVKHAPLDDANTLIRHMEVIRAFARAEANAIHDREGIWVIQNLLSQFNNRQVQNVAMKIYTEMAAAEQVNIAEAMVEHGVIETIFETLKNPESDRTEVTACVSLLLQLMGLSDQATRAVGAKESYVSILEGNDHVHHRSLQEIKSVLARFKQTEGNALLKEGFHVIAIKKLTEAIQLDKKRGIYYADRSLAYCHAGRFHEAAQDAERCVRYSPFDVQGYLRYGIAMKHQKRYTDALVALKKGRQVNPNSTQIQVMIDEVKKCMQKK